MSDNQYFLNALANNDSKEIEKLYENNFHKVKKFILQNNGQSIDAEDIFQKALLQITVRYKKEPFTIKTNFDAYLFTVCKNLWRKQLNKSKKWVTTDKDLTHNHEDQDIALSILEQKRWELFKETLELITGNCKIILRMFFNKKPYSEIVEVMNYNSETVARQRVFKCKAKLIELIKKDKRFNALKEL